MDKMMICRSAPTCAYTECGSHREHSYNPYCCDRQKDHCSLCIIPKCIEVETPGPQTVAELMREIEAVSDNVLDVVLSTQPNSRIRIQVNFDAPGYLWCHTVRPQDDLVHKLQYVLKRVQKHCAPLTCPHCGQMTPKEE